MNNLKVFVIVFALLAARAAAGPPAWDARSMPLPAQGVACVDVSADGRKVVVGTIATPGEPNVIVLSREGRILREATVGQRWVEAVAAADDDLFALVTMPAGRNRDTPTIFSCGGEPRPLFEPGGGESSYPRTIFAYGDHSNHVGVRLARSGPVVAAVADDGVTWLAGAKPIAPEPLQVGWPDAAVATAFAVHRSGRAVAGFAAYVQETPEANLFLVDPAESKPRWSRPAVTAVDRGPPPTAGNYGAPTLPDGNREPLPQRDLPVVAPLAIACGTGPALDRIAVADYAGWQRWIRSTATGRDRDYGTRFMPGRPTITVYDAAGAVVRRFDSAAFTTPIWVDLAFLPGDDMLVAFPHRWTSRGLGGQPYLPADADPRTIWLLDIASGSVQAREFPAAVASVAVDGGGRIAVSCWNGMLFLASAAALRDGTLPEGRDLGGPAIVKSLADDGWVAATAAGVVHLLDTAGMPRHVVDLAATIPPRTKPWVETARATRVDTGLWQLPGGRVESDLGGQYLIEAPGGLILIEGHAGLSFEREWRAIEAAGLDPHRVRYVLATHEHGDHAPGAYLWRLATGAEFVCSVEMAYALRHHVPIAIGYGFHPPIPTDREIVADEPLTLAGATVRAVRLPGHTGGSMGWLVTCGGKTYAAIGDLIMPDGRLGYAGSVNFSGRDVLASLAQLDALGVDLILPGHGPITSPTRYVGAGLEQGRQRGWGLIPPLDPKR